MQPTSTLLAWPTRLLIVVLVLALPAPSGAQDSEPRYDPAWHGGVLVGSAAASAWLAFAEPSPTPECRWCGIDAAGAPTPPRLDRWGARRLRWRNSALAEKLSQGSVGLALAWPLVGLTAVHRGGRGEWAPDQVVAISSVAVAELVAGLTKRTFRRARPAIVLDGAPVKRNDDVSSFVSAHSAAAFAAVISTAAIASRRHSAAAPWLWTAGLTTAGATAYLRVAANRHFLTDVLAGAAVGAATGLVMPRVFERRSSTSGRSTRTTMLAVGPSARVDTARRAARIQLAFAPGGIGVIATTLLR